MIHYQLRCAADHQFDSWFRDSAAFDAQAKAGLVECPMCGGTQVERALMAPAVPRKGNAPRKVIVPEPQPEVAPAAPAEGQQTTTVAAPAMPAEVRAMLQKLRTEVEKHCDYVGPNFADEARRIHRGESDRRGIYGETTPDQAEALADEGIEVARVPWLPRSDS
jgi:hypothetical protein